MQTLTIKVGGDMDKEVEQTLAEPGKAEKNSLTFYVSSFEQLYRIFSPSKLDLLKYLMERRKQTINEIAKGLGRKQEAISRDIHELEKHELVKLEKKGLFVFASTPFNAFKILIPSREKECLVAVTRK